MTGGGSSPGRGHQPPPFTHLTTRSCHSLRDGAIRPQELAQAAASASMSHVALTDRDGLGGAVRFITAAAEAGVTAVIGTDLALAHEPARAGWEIRRPGRTRLATTGRGSDDPDDPHDPHDPRRVRPGRGPAWLEDDAARVVFLAADRAGYADLCRTVTAAHARRRGDPHLPAEDLGTAAAHDGVIAVLGVDSPVGRLLARGLLTAAETELRAWLEVFGRDRVVLGVRNHAVAPGGSRRGRSGNDPHEPGDDVRIRRTLDLADRLGVTAAAVNDVRHLTREDVVVADVLRCIRRQVPITARNVSRSTAEAWFTTPAEQYARFRERPDLLTAAHEVAVGCEVDLDLGGVHTPRLSGLAPPAAAAELRRRSRSGLAERSPAPAAVVTDRLERELAVIDHLGVHDLFLAVDDVVDDVRANGILVACRGSAAGSLVCYALGISDVDPVANDLAFERFMNPYRDELPDIDLDVESHRREDVYDLVRERFGEERTASVAMVETFQARMALREVAKVFGVPRSEIDAVVGGLTRTRARDVRRAVHELDELRGSNLDAGQLATILDVAERIDGFPRHLAMHPCGILLADDDLGGLTPLERSAHGYRMSQFDKDDVAALGLLKLDVLGVRMLSAMRHCLDLVNGVGEAPPTRAADPSSPGRAADGSLDLEAIPHDDPTTYALLRSTHSVGVFQVESPGQQELLSRVRPERFADLVAEISLFRPGPVKAEMVAPYVARRHGDEAVEVVEERLDPVLAETYGVVVYHEQVMAAIAAVTGCDLGFADLLRRRLADDRAHPAIRAWVFARARQRGVAAPTIRRVWRQVASFASFGFCKAHAAAFAVPTERSAFLKAHVFPEFFAGLLTHDPGMYPRRLLLDECRRFGVAVLAADVNHSSRSVTVEVVDRGLADHRLGLTTARRAHLDGRDPRPHLPVGWSWDPDGDAPRPPSGIDAGDAGDGYRFAVRIGLDDVAPITAAEVTGLLRRRPFTSLGDFSRRGGVSRPTATALVDAGALDRVAGLGRPDGPAHRRVLRLAVEELWAGRRRTAASAAVDGGGRVDGGGSSAVQSRLALDDLPELPPEHPADRVRAELAATGLDVSRHVLSFYEPLLTALGVQRAHRLAGLADGSSVRVAGVKVAVQSPPQRSGQRVLFLSLDDRTGQTQVTYFARALPATAWTVRHAWLLVAEGRLVRRGTGAATVTGTRAWDLSRLWRAWQEGWLDEALRESGTPAPHDRQPLRPVGLHASEFGRGSR